MTKLLDNDGNVIHDGETTWSRLLPVLVATAASTKAPEGARKLAWAQLVELARIVDEHIANLRVLERTQAKRDDGENVCADCGVGAGEHAFGCPQLGESVA